MSIITYFLQVLLQWSIYKIPMILEKNNNWYGRLSAYKWCIRLQKVHNIDKNKGTLILMKELGSA